MIDEMANLAQELRQWDLVEDLKLIDGAKIPVIKAKINLRRLCAREGGETVSDSEATELDMLPIDITFDDSPTTHSSCNSPSILEEKNSFPGTFGALPV